MPVTNAPAAATLAPMTTATPVSGALFASIDDFVARWNEESAITAAAGGEPMTLMSGELAVVVGTGLGGTDVFGGRLGETGLVGGLVNPDTNAVEQVVVVLNPFGATSAEIIVTVGELVIPDEIWVDSMTAYTELMSAAPDEHAYVAGATHDVVVSVTIDDADISFVSVTVAPLTDEASAVANAERLLGAVVDATQLTG